jgi:nucleoside-diphosphate-sugar epimerase
MRVVVFGATGNIRTSVVAALVGVHAGARITHALRLQRAEPGWVDLAVSAPLMDTTAARTRLGWTPTRSSIETLEELLAGFAAASGTETPPLHPGRKGELVPLRSGGLS